VSAFSPSVSTVNVHANYRVGDGPDSGSVVFTFTDRLVSATDDVIFASGASFEARLGVNTGSISVDLPCVDDPDISPNSWSIKVEEKLKSGRGATYYIKPTLAMVDTGLNLRSVLVPGTLPAPEATVRIGVPGGLAVYNSNGDVIDAAGNVIAGGAGGGLTSVTSADITDATATGRSLLKATDATNARTLIGAGTSSLTLGTTGTTAKAGNYVPTWTEITAKPTTFAPIIGTGAADAKAGNYVPAWTEVTGKPTTFAPSAHTHTAADLSGVVKTVNGGAPDAAGNVTVAAGAPTLANLPAGSVLYTATTTRPTSRTDIMVIFTGADPGSAALDNDMWWSA